MTHKAIGKKLKPRWLQSSLLLLFAIITSPIAHPNQPLYLNDAIAHAIETNPSIALHTAELAAQQYRLKKVRGNYHPKLGIHISAGAESSDTPSLRSQNLNNRFMKPIENKLTVKQFIFDGGLLKNQIKEQHEQIHAADYHLQDSIEQVVIDTITAYYQVLKTKKLLALAHENLSLHQEIAQKVKQRYAGKISDIANVHLAVSRMRQAHTTLLNAQQAHEDSQTHFLSVVHLPAEHLVPLRLAKVEFPFTLHNTINTVMSGNLKLKAIHAEINQASANVHAAAARYFPTLDLEVETSYDHDVGGIKGRNQVTRGMLVLNYNLYNGGSDAAERNARAAKKTSKKNELLHTQRKLAEQVTQYWHVLNNSVKQVNQLKAYVNSSKALYQSYREQFTYGKQTLFNVLDGGNQHYNANVLLTERLYQDNIIYYQLVGLSGALSHLMAG